MREQGLTLHASSVLYIIKEVETMSPTRINNSTPLIKKIAARAFTLGEASNGGYLDLYSSDQAKFERNWLKALEGDKYYGKPEGLRTFLGSFGATAKMYV